MPSISVDTTNWKILSELQDNARITHVELARAVFLSSSPCLQRVKKREESGLIRRYVTLLDPQKVGLTVSVFIQVALEKQIELSLANFERSIRDRPAVMECYLMTGDADYLLRVVIPYLPAFERVMLAHLTKIPGIASIKSSFALKQVKYQTALPLPDKA